MKLKNLFNKQLIIILTIFIISLNLFFFWNKYSINNQRNYFLNEITKISRQNFLLKESLYEQISFSEKEIDINHNLNNFPYFAWRYFDQQCSSCVNEVLEIFKNHTLKIGTDNIIIFATAKNLNELKSWLISNGLSDIKIYLFEFDQFNFFKDLKEQYFFILESPTSGKMIFKPILEIPSLTEEYLEMIEIKYFDSSACERN